MVHPHHIREQFPIFRHHPALVYLDNAATTHKPQVLVEGVADFYARENANIHRGVYDLAAQTTLKYEAVRSKIARFIGAADPRSVVYTSGTTAGINLVAQSFLAPRLQPGDEVLISAMEHHANLIPWQMICKQKGGRLRIIPIDRAGNLDMGACRNLLSERTKMLAVTQVSNTLGTVNPVAELIRLAHARNIPVLIDGAQGVAHYPVEVAAWDADFYVFSGHKVFGPTGIGALYGKPEHLAAMPPGVFGGDMIRTVSYTDTTFADPPQRFEAGTTNIAGVIGLGYALDYLSEIPKKAIGAYLAELTGYTLDKLHEVEGLQLIGEAEKRSAIFSFLLKGVHPHDVATFLGAEQIAVRAGHHCTQPLMDFYGIPATTRASCTIYNTREDIDQLVTHLKAIKKFFG